MNIFIEQLKCLGIGCCVSSLFLGCILYADDILLLSPSITGLQNMLDKCSELAKLLSLEFNVEKSHCIAFGSMSNVTITQLSLCGISVEWCRVVKYLGVYLQSGRSLKFDISATKRAFYAACNSILCMVLELVKLHYYAYKRLIVYVYLRMPFML